MLHPPVCDSGATSTWPSQIPLYSHAALSSSVGVLVIYEKEA